MVRFMEDTIKDDEIYALAEARRIAEYIKADPDQMLRYERPFRFHANEE